MDERAWLTERFEAHRPRLRAVAYRMLGSLSEADDAVQEAWLRLSRADTGGVENLAGWLTTVVARVCLNMLRARESRREAPLDVRMPDPIISRESGVDPEQEALLADAVGLALLVVLDTLTPAERLAFVLHDLFAVPFDEIAPILGAHRPRPGNSPAAPAAGCRERPRLPTLIARANAKLWTRSSPPPATATSTRSSPCSTPTSCCGPTAARRGPARPSCFAARGPWLNKRSPARGSSRSCDRR